MRTVKVTMPAAIAGNSSRRMLVERLAREASDPHSTPADRRQAAAALHAHLGAAAALDQGPAPVTLQRNALDCRAEQGANRVLKVCAALRRADPQLAKPEAFGDLIHLASSMLADGRATA